MGKGDRSRHRSRHRSRARRSRSRRDSHDEPHRRGHRDRSSRRSVRSRSRSWSRHEDSERKDRRNSERRTERSSDSEIARLAEVLTGVVGSNSKRSTHFLNEKIIPEFDPSTKTLSASDWIEKINDCGLTSKVQKRLQLKKVTREEKRTLLNEVKGGETYNSKISDDELSSNRESSVGEHRDNSVCDSIQLQTILERMYSLEEENRQRRACLTILAGVNSLVLNVVASIMLSISKSSRLKTLNPFSDGSVILRLEGVLHQAPISTDERYPVILPGNH
ncbi:UPF0430 protein CG31712-like [Belonocnema kinseyi]|uniref:UPF0430 protein CG31712-like n=1 Tax=Belonocnema kinseyi TaxID=2817044 RepID=UPI00143E02C4|nr:UPF0430 protein CG31712-like [Belonocnema kinseyi]